MSLNHVFIPPPTTAQELHQATEKLLYSLRTRYKFRNSIEDPLNPYIPAFHTHSKSWIPPLMPYPLEQEIRHFKDNLNQELLNTPMPHNTPDPLKRHLQFITKNENLIIVQADKNIGLAVFDYTHYQQLVHSHLHNDQYYRQINNDELDQATTRIYNEFLELRNTTMRHLQPPHYTKNAQKFLDQTLLSTHHLPKFRVTPKLHKKFPTKHHPPLITRPIVGATNWITTNASIYICEVLKPFFANDILRPTNSTKVARDIQNTYDTQYPPGTILFSFDVVNMYNEMQLPLISQAMRTFSQQHNLPHFITDLVDWILRNNYFAFENNYYQQLYGMAMGTNMAVLVANVFMTIHFEQHPLVQTQIRDTIRLYRRYVDDIFGIWTGTPDALHNFFNAANTMIPGIHFTLVTSTHSIEFLDLNIFFNNNMNLQTKTHQKTLNTYTYITNASYHPTPLKKGFIKSELIRYIRCSSNINDFYKLRDTFRTRLTKRGYSNKFIYSIFNKVSYNNRYNYLLPKRSENTNITPFIIRYHTRLKILKVGQLLRNINIQQHWGQSHNPPPHIIYCIKSNRNLAKQIQQNRHPKRLTKHQLN